MNIWILKLGAHGGKLQHVKMEDNIVAKKKNARTERLMDKGGAGKSRDRLVRIDCAFSIAGVKVKRRQK